MTAVGNFTPMYDNNGNVTSDSLHTYTWDADGNSVTVDGVGLTFDAFDRMVEQNRSGTHTQIVYSPGGAKLALMSGQTLQKAFVRLPGTATAVYTATAPLDHYQHGDWLGNSRLGSQPYPAAPWSETAYAPFGEPYAQSGAADLSFTGQNSDTTSGDYDFLYREYSNQGRWAQPDPSGLAAVDPTNPQSWNRYAYVLNNPLASTDPLGLDYCPFNGAAGCAYQIDGSYVSAADYYSAIQADAVTILATSSNINAAMAGNGSYRVVYIPDSYYNTLDCSQADANTPCQGAIGVATGGYTLEYAGDAATTTFTSSFVTNFLSPSFYRQQFAEGGCLANFSESAAEPLMAVGHATEAAEKIPETLLTAAVSATGLRNSLDVMRRAKQLAPDLGPLAVAASGRAAASTARWALAAEHAVPKGLPVALWVAVDAGLAWGLVNEIGSVAKGTCH